MASISTTELIRLLESKGLLPPEVLLEIREQIKTNPQTATSRKIIRWLVKQEYLSRFQGQEILSGRLEDAAAHTDAGGDDLDVIDDLEEIPGGGLDALQALDQGAAIGGGLIDESLMQAAGMGPAVGVGGTLGLPGAGKGKKGPTNVWDSKLLLFGGGALALLSILGVVLFLTISRTTGDEAFDAAEDHYTHGQYTQAIAKFERYVESFPEHPKVSVARVHRGLSQMRRAVNGAKGQRWVRALDETKKIIKEIRTQEAFSESRDDLAVMIHHIAEGLAKFAEDQPDADVVKRCRETVEMARNVRYVPKKYRDDQLLANVESRLARVEHDLNRGRLLQEAIAKIKEYVELSKTAEVYQTRKALLRLYPDMGSNAELQEAVMSASKSERIAVKFVKKFQAALTTEPKNPAKTMLLTTTVVHGPPPGVAGSVVFAMAEGAVYALDAATGKVRWRRFVGCDAVAPPQRISPLPGSDLLLIDSQRGELLRVTAKTGELRWRLALDGLHTTPFIMGKRAVLATDNGKTSRIYYINLETGATDGYTELPQPVRSPPIVDQEQRYLYQAGEHSNLYILSATDGACENVVYLGHDADAIVAPPAVVGEYLFLAENRHAKTAWIRVFHLEDDGASAKQVQEIRVEGHIHLSPIIFGRTVIVSTDLGGVFLFQIDPSNKKQPLIKGPRKTAALKQRIVTHLHVRGSRLWAASQGFASYDIQAASGQLASRWLDHDKDEFLQPLQVVGDVMFHVRRESGKPGIVVTAVQMDQREKFWETRLAPPPASGAVFDAQRKEVVVLTADGALYQIPLDKLLANSGFAVATESVSVKYPPSPISRIVSFPNGKLVFASEQQREQVLTFDPHSSGPLLRWVKLPDAAGGLPTSLGGTLLIPGAIGQVFAFDPFTNRMSSDPFIPSVESGRSYRWRSSGAAGKDVAGTNDALLSDGDVLYRIAARSKPKQRLAALSQCNLQQPLASSIVRLKRTAYAIDSGGELAAFSLPDLKQGKTWKLDGSPVWGPWRVGERVLLAALVEVSPDLRRYQYSCLDDDQQLLWQSTLRHGPPAGPPLGIAGGYLLASLDGVVSKLDNEGQPLSTVKLDGALVSGPIRLDERHVLLTGRDSVLYVLNISD